MAGAIEHASFRFGGKGKLNYQPIIIIGAGRSGTNILRDTLTQLPNWETWDCDEINLIWRHGNLGLKNDIFKPEHASESVRSYIRGQFDKLQRSTQAKVIVEKTCANSLRVPFIEAILPSARYIYIVRDGRDVALSAAKRWTASVEPGYLLKKLRYVPPTDIVHYGIRFIRNRIHQTRSREKRQAVWGPIFPGMDTWAKTRPLIEVCAQQWATCVEQSDQAFENMSRDKVIQINYESLVTDPVGTMAKIEAWYGSPILEKLPDTAISAIHPGSANGWMKHNDKFTPEAASILKPALKKHGYETTT